MAGCAASKRSQIELMRPIVSCRALASMSSVEDNWPSIDEVGDDEGGESLRDLLVYAGDYGKEGSAWAVCYMAGYPELQVKLVRGNLLMPLIEMVKSGTRRCKKAAERALKALAA